MRKPDLRAGSHRHALPSLLRVVLTARLECDGEENSLALHLRDQILERVPGGGVRPLEILEHQHQRPLLRREPKKVCELFQQMRLAAAAYTAIARTLQGRVQRVQLAPQAGALYRPAANPPKHPTPHPPRGGGQRVPPPRPPPPPPPPPPPRGEQPEAAPATPAT